MPISKLIPSSTYMAWDPIYYETFTLSQDSLRNGENCGQEMDIAEGMLCCMMSLVALESVCITIFSVSLGCMGYGSHGGDRLCLKLGGIV